MEYFQLRKNARQVIRIFRGPYEGYDITRLQTWYRERDGTEYKPGRAVASTVQKERRQILRPPHRPFSTPLGSG